MEFTWLEDLALARVEPFGLHLFEFILYVLLGILALFALRSLMRSFGMILLKPKREDFLSSGSVEMVAVECLSCGWKGQVFKLRKRCPKCGGDSFI
jgi:hypothetical protein